MPLSTKTGNRKAKQVLSGGLVPVEGRRIQERGFEAKYGGNTMCMCM
jgi:hypothetical protein